MGWDQIEKDHYNYSTFFNNNQGTNFLPEQTQRVRCAITSTLYMLAFFLLNISYFDHLLWNSFNLDLAKKSAWYGLLLVLISWNLKKQNSLKLLVEKICAYMYMYMYDTCNASFFSETHGGNGQFLSQKLQTLLTPMVGCGRMVVGFTTTHAVSAYHHWSCEFETICTTISGS